MILKTAHKESRGRQALCLDADFDRSAAPDPVRPPRVHSIDLLRGAVMILMALDHVRDFIGVPGNPTNLATATTPLFLTRWITHICAPTFFLLTGTGAYLARARRSTPELSRFLWTRGLWLIALELTVLRCFGYQFNADYRVTMLIILWALGWSMICLAALVRLPLRFVAVFGVTTIALHNAFDRIAPAAFGVLAPVWTVLHAQGIVVATPRFVVFAAYPLVPWIGVTAAGYALGPIFEWAAPRRRAGLLRLGIGLTVAFAVLRFANIYGDPAPWTMQPSLGRTLLSFLNTTKYPPSLLFLSMTLGPALLLLWIADGASEEAARPVRIFGTVPLFYFVLHLPLIHLLAVALCYSRYGAVHWMFESPRLDRFPFTAPPGWGYSLPIVYLVWAAVVVALYPACAWYSNLKRRRASPWLSYL